MKAKEDAMDDSMRVVFDEMTWDEPAQGVRFKAVSREGTRLRLVEFTSDFVEHAWCTKGHIGYVLEGTLELSFVNTTLKLSAGQGIFILAGEAEKHKAKVIGEKARLILVESV
jgi:quercetin dioxygenase-like cupin family protein